LGRDFFELGAATKFTCSLDDPKKWREEVERKVEAMLGGTSCSAPQRARLLQRLGADLRRDIKNGFMIPADALRSTAGGSSTTRLQRTSSLTVENVQFGISAGRVQFQVSRRHNRGSAESSTTSDDASSGRRRGPQASRRSPRPRPSPSAKSTLRPSPKPTPTGLVEPAASGALNEFKAGTASSDERKKERAVGFGESSEEDDFRPIDYSEGSGEEGRDSNALDFSLLPPLGLVSVKQKALLMRDLERQARVAKTQRKAKLRGRMSCAINLSRMKSKAFCEPLGAKGRLVPSVTTGPLAPLGKGG